MANNAQTKHDLQRVQIEQQGQTVSVGWKDGSQSRFHAVWLRANSQGEDSVDAGNGQRLTSIAQLPVDCAVQVASVNANGGMRVKFAADEFESHYSGSWLRQHQYDRMRPLPAGWINPELELWDATLARDCGSYEQVMHDDAALDDWLQKIYRYGFACLDGCPRESGEVNRIAERFGFVRETNYGRYFDVKSVADPINLAYTASALEVHTDNPYRDPVPGLQFLMALENSNDGGESIVVDGYAAAANLRDEEPDAFQLLCRHPIQFQFQSPGINLTASAPIISLSSEGEIIQIRHNNRAIRPPRLPFDATPMWYEACTHFVERVNDTKMQLSFPLKPGELFVVDNHRVLHGRSAFDPNKGDRHLQGCYSEKDTLRSRLALTT